MYIDDIYMGKYAIECISGPCTWVAMLDVSFLISHLDQTSGLNCTLTHSFPSPEIVGRSLKVGKFEAKHEENTVSSSIPWRFIFQMLADMLLGDTYKDKDEREAYRYQVEQGAYREFEPLSRLEGDYAVWCRTFNPTTSLVGEQFWLAVARLSFSGNPPADEMTEIPRRMRRIYDISLLKRALFKREGIKALDPDPDFSRERSSPTADATSTNSDTADSGNVLGSRSQVALPEGSKRTGAQTEEDSTDRRPYQEHQPFAAHHHSAALAHGSRSVGRAEGDGDGGGTTGSLVRDDSNDPDTEGAGMPPIDESEKLVQTTVGEASAEAVNQEELLQVADGEDDEDDIPQVAQHEAGTLLDEGKRDIERLLGDSVVDEGGIDGAEAGEGERGACADERYIPAATTYPIRGRTTLRNAK
ncbi:hypothetical protein BDW22DRAFT_40733 [Trametopsis cervina]|nr:hypothetical protein BDW22DRAFT_40733 [Trametopsis cervina]